MKIAIHQPNYFPWLGYFKKIAKSDVFIFLDDASFSKGSYTNRVKLLCKGFERWLTIPVSFHLGQSISEISIVDRDWALKHRDILFDWYREADAFTKTFPEIESFLMQAAEKENLAEINIEIITAIAHRLKLNVTYKKSSHLNMNYLTGSDRLIALIKAVSPCATYYSGQGGAKYQDEERFVTAGVRLEYLEPFTHVYRQNSETFLPGLSVLDAIFHIGWAGTTELLSL
ncbi:MAG: WbqC family protein [Alphaproteobacteria bacterium]